VTGRVQSERGKGAWHEGTFLAYTFGVAVFDNAQVRHAYSPGVLKLVFE
jgi:hypothetical protein